MAKNNKQSTFAELIADSELITEEVQIGNHSVTIRELSGRQRFELSEKVDDSRWETLLWVCMIGLIDPAPESITDLEPLKAEWVVKIANAVLSLSGLEGEAIETAGEE